MRTALEETHEWLKDYLQRRRDIGIGKAIVNLVLNARNPFEPEARRLPKPGSLFGACLFTFAVVWFLYFNVAR
jgi:hypothetical protein